MTHIMYADIVKLNGAAFRLAQPINGKEVSHFEIHWGFPNSGPLPRGPQTIVKVELKLAVSRCGFYEIGKVSYLRHLGDGVKSMHKI